MKSTNGEALLSAFFGWASLCPARAGYVAVVGGKCAQASGSIPIPHLHAWAQFAKTLFLFDLEHFQGAAAFGPFAAAVKAQTGGRGVDLVLVYETNGEDLEVLNLLANETTSLIFSMRDLGRLAHWKRVVISTPTSRKFYRYERPEARAILTRRVLVPPGAN